jgi:N-acetylneuraminic acid mutarotase
MATHSRLGAASAAKVLPLDLFKTICSYITQPYIFVIGGLYWEYKGRSLRNCDRYDFATKSWQKQKSLPTTRSGLGAVSLNNKIYIIGGINLHNR